MSGSLWIFVDLLLPVVMLIVLLGLIVTAKPDPERAVYRHPLPEDDDKKGLNRRRRRGGRTAL